MKEEQILQKHAEENMIQWDVESFKKTHPKLYRTIINSINEALNIDSVVGQSEQLVCDLCDEDGWITENKGDIVEHRLCKCDKAN